MPLVRISLMEGKPASHREKISDAVHRSMVETLNVRDTDRFQIITEHPPSCLRYARQAGPVQRSDDLVIIQITLNAGRTQDMKQRFFERAVALLAQDVGLRKEDLLIGLVEVAADSWYLVE